jgi:hypothetical protein
VARTTLHITLTFLLLRQPNLNAGWATASWERKQEIIADYTYFELGMFYFLANDAAVPKVRTALHLFYQVGTSSLLKLFY